MNEFCVADSSEQTATALKEIVGRDPLYENSAVGDRMGSHRSDWTIGSAGTKFTMAVARTAELRNQANQLVHDVYVRAGYEKDAMPFMNAANRLFTVLIRTMEGVPVATVSLAFDGANGLPCDDIFQSHIAPLRSSERKLVEVTRLAIAPEFVKVKVLLVRLFNFIYIQARKIQCADDFVIEVNPRHESYYRRLLGFSRLSQARPCPRVQGAPASLLRLRLSHPENEIERCQRQPQKRTSQDRSLYPFFYPKNEEAEVVAFLACQ